MDIATLSDLELSTDAPALPTQAPRWEAVAGAYLAEVAQRTGSERTPQEYGRYIRRF